MSMTSPVDKKQIKTNWNDRNYSCDMFVDPPGQCWEDFTHSVDELVMVIEGKLEVEMQGGIFYPEVLTFPKNLDQLLGGRSIPCC